MLGSLDTVLDVFRSEVVAAGILLEWAEDRPRQEVVGLHEGKNNVLLESAKEVGRVIILRAITKKKKKTMKLPRRTAKHDTYYKRCR